MDVSPRAQDDILPMQSSHLGGVQPGLNGEQEKGVVATSAPGTLIRGREEGFHLGMGQKPNQSPRLALVGNGEDLLDFACLRRLLIGDVAEERANGGQAKVARAGRVV